MQPVGPSKFATLLGQQAREAECTVRDGDRNGGREETRDRSHREDTRAGREREIDRERKKER